MGDDEYRNSNENIDEGNNNYNAKDALISNTKTRKRTKIKWSPVDVGENVQLEEKKLKYPKFLTHANPITVSVKAGEVLYLPSLWYHRVTQTEVTIAVNFWHDMKFGYNYVYYNFLDQISSASKSL